MWLNATFRVLGEGFLCELELQQQNSVIIRSLSGRLEEHEEGERAQTSRGSPEPSPLGRILGTALEESTESRKRILRSWAIAPKKKDPLFLIPPLPP